MSKSVSHSKEAKAREVVHAPLLPERQNSLGTHVGVQRDATGSGVQPSATSLVHEVLNSPGQPLDTETRSFMEPRFGYDFSSVRVHTDDKAAESARAVNALAYTAGSHIVFQGGPGSASAEGHRQLMAHELTHVVQQSSGPVTGIPVGEGLSVSEPSDAFEQEADAVTKGKRPASATGSGRKAGLHGTDITVQRIMTPDKKPPGPPGTSPITNPTQPSPPNALSPTPLPQDVWERIETRITPELGIDFLEIGRVVAVDVKQQLLDLFAPYEDSITDANQRFASYVNIALAGAGNVPQDPGPSDPTAKSPTYSITGGLGGALAQAGQVVVGKILDTPNVGVAKQRANLDAEALLGDTLTTDSPLYESFEEQAVTEVHQKAQVDWAQMQETFPPEILPKPEPSKYVRYVRREFGVHSKRVQDIIKSFQNTLAKYLDGLKKRLETMKERAKRRRGMAGAIGGMFAGGIIGAAIGLGAGGGFTAGGALGAGLGAIFGVVGGGLLGAGGAALFEAGQGKPEDKSRSEAQREEDRKQLRTLGSEEDEEEKKQEPPPGHSEFPEREP